LTAHLHHFLYLSLLTISPLPFSSSQPQPPPRNDNVVPIIHPWP
jgi:hypothetical protein